VSEGAADEAAPSIRAGIPAPTDPFSTFNPESMSAFFTYSSHMPCGECGASVAAAETDSHVCDRERVLDFRMFHLRDEIASFDDAVRRFLESPKGRFAQWCAERERPAA
jgi:hypothetical protein